MKIYFVPDLVQDFSDDELCVLLVSSVMTVFVSFELKLWPSSVISDRISSFSKFFVSSVDESGFL